MAIIPCNNRNCCGHDIRVCDGSNEAFMRSGRFLLVDVLMNRYNKISVTSKHYLLKSARPLAQLHADLYRKEQSNFAQVRTTNKESIAESKHVTLGCSHHNEFHKSTTNKTLLQAIVTILLGAVNVTLAQQRRPSISEVIIGRGFQIM